MDNRKGKILTITSMKGGVGKTTTTMMLANIFSKCGKRVLIIDLDLYNGNLAFAYNVKVRSTILNLCDDLANNRISDSISDDYFTKINNNLYLISAPKDPRQANKINTKYLDNVLTLLCYKYDVILIDTNHVLSVPNMISFEHSYKIIDICTNDSFDLQSTKTFVAICKNMEVDNLVLILNNAIDNRKNYYSIYDIKEITKKNVDYTIPNSLYIKKFDQLIMDGKLGEFDLNLKGDIKKSYESFASQMIDLIDGDGSADNEEK